MTSLFRETLATLSGVRPEPQVARTA